jgi:YD repeat-containing protein
VEQRETANATRKELGNAVVSDTNLGTLYDGMSFEVIRESVVYGNGSERRYEYNHLGKAEKVTDGEGVVWEGNYDGAGRLVREKGRPGIEKEYKYDALGRIVEIKSGGEVSERYGYGSRGRTVAYTDGAGNNHRGHVSAAGKGRYRFGKQRQVRAYTGRFQELWGALSHPILCRKDGSFRVWPVQRDGRHSK